VAIGNLPNLPHIGDAPRFTLSLKFNMGKYRNEIRQYWEDGCMSYFRSFNRFILTRLALLGVTASPANALTLAIDGALLIRGGS
jgi:hypothetical protein